jgi:hypothetical protein
MHIPCHSAASRGMWAGCFSRRDVNRVQRARPEILMQISVLGVV